MENHFVILDGNALVHRSFHALPPLTNKKGEPTGAIYGFFLMFLKMLMEQKPKYVAVAFDLKGPTFRHEKYVEYKAKRVKAPDELYAQFDPIKEILKILRVPIYEKQGFEADDVIGTLARIAKETQERPVVDIMTGDMDALQLVDENTRVLSFAKGLKEAVIYDEKAIEERYGLRSNQLIDYKALHGDPSDNIPGVVGIGAKSANELLEKYGSLDEIYVNLGEIKESWRNKLAAGRDMALLSKELVTIDKEVPIEFRLEDCEFGKGDIDRLKKRFEELNFATLKKRVEQIEEHYRPEQVKMF